jgi:hypothetical protein
MKPKQIFYAAVGAAAVKASKRMMRRRARKALRR